MIYTSSTYSAVKQKLRSKYGAKLLVIESSFSKIKNSKIYPWLLNNKCLLENFSSINWYFLKQLEDYLQISGSLPKLSKNSSDFSPEDDVVFEKWNQSEFADSFLKALNQGHSIYHASQMTLKVLENHLVGLGSKHLGNQKISLLDYRPQQSLGEFVRAKTIQELKEDSVKLGDKILRIKAYTETELTKFTARIETALSIIVLYSPSSWERFQAFTDVIVPIKQKEFVSFSHQELPGYSMINLYDRDFIDLMDDLIHENGHHHLNYYLNLTHLIEEPIECIYYSPWRRSLRPLRGIYHAYFTFFWAFKLFYDLAANQDISGPWYTFSRNELEKIRWRTVEEFWMLEFTYFDLHRAYKNGLIERTGWNLIQGQRDQLIKLRSAIKLLEKKLGPYSNDFKHLKSTLNHAAKTFQKNH
jgi:hypothetical protein